MNSVVDVIVTTKLMDISIRCNFGYASK